MKRSCRDARATRRIVFRGTPLGDAQFCRIQRLIDGQLGITRQEIARQTCKSFGWRRNNGLWAVRAARQLLVRLDAAGSIRLPAPRRTQGRPRRCNEAAMVGLGDAASMDVVSSSPLPARAGSVLLVRPICSKELPHWRAHIERFHYLGDAALVGESIRYMAYLNGELVALLSFGAAALRNAPRDRFIGWDEATKKARLHLIVNNARFLVLPSNRSHDLASRVLGATLRRLSQDWEHVYGHRVVLVETFVDTSRFRGTCYQASNWTCVGETKGWSKSGGTYRFNGQPKSVWLYALRRDFRKQLCSSAARCSRQERLMALDVEKLPLHGQGGLFDILDDCPDARKARGLRHKLRNVLAIGVCATLAGVRSVAAMAQWAAEQSPETLKILGSKRGKPPSERTLRRVFSTVDVAEIDRLTGQWVAAQQQSVPGDGLAIDGKTERGSRDGEIGARHLLSAVMHSNGTVVGQVDVDSKTNEITRVEPLFKDMDIKGKVVTADALLTQKEVARHLVEDKKADYVLPVKDNQPTLRQDIETLNLDAFPPSTHDD